MFNCRISLLSADAAEPSDVPKTSPAEPSPDGSEQSFFGSEHERITLEALEHTKIAAAQFAAIALSKGADDNVVKELSVLQSTLFTLQHQQVFQLQLIQKLQSQLETKGRKRASGEGKAARRPRSPSPPPPKRKRANEVARGQQEDAAAADG